MMLSGSLTDWSVGDLLQMLHITKKTVSLHVTGLDRSGVVYFEEGAIVNASVSLGGGGAIGETRDEVVEAVYVLELLGEGDFEIQNEVPPHMIESLPVAEALELAGQYLHAERQLGETGLLAARGLRLAQVIDQPILLSEQVWNAISASIPAFTFPELEERLGRAAAVSTVEQFRDLGILEAVLDEVEPTREASQPETRPGAIAQQAVVEHPVVEDAPEEYAVAGHPPAEPADISDEEIDSQLADAFAGSWLPPAEDQVEEIVPSDVDEMRPIVAEAADDSIIIPDPADEVVVEAPEPAPAPTGATPGVSSLAAAIRAAAAPGGTPAPTDDESKLLSEAAGDPTDHVDGAAANHADGSLRRTVKSLVGHSDGASAGGAGDLGARFRQAVAAEQED